jgi:hypothetical protein
MDPSDLAIEILKDIRDEVRDTNARLDALRDDTNARFAETHVRLARIEHRQTEAEARVSAEVSAVVRAVLETRDLLRDDRALRERVDDHERRLAALERRGG